MKKLILILMLMPTLVLAQKVVVNVPGMVCQMCVQGIQKNFKTAVVNPEKDVIVDLDRKTVTVILKEKITDEDIRTRVTNAGYNAENITWVDGVK